MTDDVRFDKIKLARHYVFGESAEEAVAEKEPPLMSLSQEEVLRYSRHLIMPEVGVDGQEKLKNASILLIGCGGLGSPLSMYLSAAGIGRLGLVDDNGLLPCLTTSATSSSSVLQKACKRARNERGRQLGRATR